MAKAIRKERELPLINYLELYSFILCKFFFYIYIYIYNGSGVFGN